METRRPGLEITRERLAHLERQAPLSEETKLSLGAGSWTREGEGNVRAAVLQVLLLQAWRCVHSARAATEHAALVALSENERPSHAGVPAHC